MGMVIKTAPNKDKKQVKDLKAQLAETQAAVTALATMIEMQAAVTAGGAK